MRIVLLSICILCAIPLQAHAQGELSKVIADGWIRLFDGESSFGWTGKASITKPAVPILDGKSPQLTVVGIDKVDGAIRCTTPFQEFELAISYSTPHLGSATIFLVPVDATEHSPKMDRFVLPGSARPTTASFRVTNESFSGKTSTKTDGVVEFPESKRTNPNQPVHLVIASGSVNLQRILVRPI
ncbi:MAG TPA: hypothetical protein VFE62_12665, partial [Gemmataceae bacterium]|nr:hypothetical protein [Gemmataceae bacterium]